MNKDRAKRTINIICLVLMIISLLTGCTGGETEHDLNGSDLFKPDTGETGLTMTENSPTSYILPVPEKTGDISVEEALESRRSRRNFSDKALSAEQLSQILWAAYGITEPGRGLRTAPSAGAVYPLEIYAVVGNVEDIDNGLYKYDSSEHKIILVKSGDIRDDLSAAALNQAMIRNAPVTIVYTAVFDRIEGRYGERGRERYVFMEIGHSAQNIYLQAEAMGLGTCAIGAFTDDRVHTLLDLPVDETPLYFLPVGHVG